MKIERGFLRSRVARRILARFMLSALIPILIVAALSFWQVTKMLSAQSGAQLQHFSKNYGMAVLERLQFAAAGLRHSAVYPSAQASLGEVFAGELKNVFAAVAPLDSARDTPPFGGAALAQALSHHEQEPLTTRLIVLNDSAQGPRLFMSFAATGGRRLLAQLEPDYVWGGEDSLPFMTDICVLDNRWQVLFCSKSELGPAMGDLVPRLVSGATGPLEWRYRGEEVLVGQRELFLEAQFHYSKWTVLAVQPRTQAFAPIQMFSRVYPAAILLSILFVVFLSIGQIRISLIPLERLLEGTRNLVNKRFFSPVAVTSNDEFGTLAESFNAMSNRIGRQFHAFHILAQIDRLILTKPDFEQVAKMVLKHLPTIAPSDCAGLLVIGAAGQGQAYLKDYRRDGEQWIEPLAWLAAEAQAPAAGAQPLRRAAVGPAYLAPFAKLGAQVCDVFPIVSGERPAGAIVLGYRQAPAPDADDAAQVRDLADRMAVALAAVEHERQLYHQAHYDALTHLPNRQLLMEILQRELAHTQRQDYLTALLFIDLDHFKNVNDSMGHAAGDQLLVQVAERLQGCVREADTIARLGGDEFTVVLSDLAKPRDAGRVAEQILKALTEPFSIYGQEHFIGASIGIAVYPYDGSSGAELLRNADTAMYRAKHEGRGRYLFFKEEMNAETMERLRLERDLRQALQRDELLLYFQPKLEVASDIVVSAEALLRWRHPERGMISPALFIAVAEDTGLIDALGAWALQAACRQFLAWQAQGLGLERIAVNVSVRQFKQRNFVDQVRALLAATGIPPQALQLEITESLFLEDLGYITRTLEGLHELGIQLAIDDFGTGYSSLGYLNRFPIHTLKIDRSFMLRVPEDGNATALVKSIIALADNLRKHIVIEGIETEAQMAFARTSGCREAQGYYLSRPLAAEQFAEFVAQYNGVLPKAARSA